jgi:hypothetical protein
MTRVAVIHHLDQPFLGHAAAALRDVELVEHFGTLRALDEVDGIVSPGGEDSVSTAGWRRGGAAALGRRG